MVSFFYVVNTIFLSILLQALPFMLIGAMISSMLHVFISDQFVVKIFPEKNGVGFLTAIAGGLIFPVCECASVPVITGLMKKGVAMPVAVTFMLAAPIVNPISIMSTLYAFPDNPLIALYRVLFGIITSAGIGFLLLCYPKTKYLKDTDDFDVKTCTDGMEIYLNFSYKIEKMFLHTNKEFFTAGKYLILGAFITALIRTLVPADFFAMFNKTHSHTGILIMMLFSFLFSACSTSDAFIARSFYGAFSLTSIMGFLVYGPMMDIKNIFMLLSFFKKRFVFELVIIITVINIIFISAMGFIFL